MKELIKMMADQFPGLILRTQELENRTGYFFDKHPDAPAGKSRHIVITNDRGSVRSDTYAPIEHDTWSAEEYFNTHILPRATMVADIIAGRK